MKRLLLLAMTSVAAIACQAASLWGQPAAALGPESPEVREVIDRAVGYLDQADKGLFMSTLGGRCVVALALLKAGQGRQHRHVQAAVDACRAAEEAGDNFGMTLQEKSYSVGLAAIFLSYIDSLNRGDELQTMVKTIQIDQRESGGWSYRSGPRCDTSVSQYALLGLWEAHQAGSEAPTATIVKAANWLIRTQDPSGSWGYQGIDPGNFEPVKQEQTTQCMSAAGASGALICAHLLGQLRLKKTTEATGLPASLRRVDEPPAEAEDAPSATVSGVDQQRLKQSIQRAYQWTANNFDIDNGGYQVYYLYTLERYMSFRELAEGRKVPNIDWYRQGYEKLRETQSAAGSWDAGCGPSIDTAFGILFLLRSTQDSIRRRLGLGDGLLAGGRGLPKTLTGARLEGGQVVGAELKATTDTLLKILSNPDHPDFGALTRQSMPLELSGDAQTKNQQIARLLRLVQGVDPDARLVAVRSLSRSGELSTVPSLIYALSDPDPRVVGAARNGLRRLSRRVDGFGMPLDPSPQQLAAATSAWKNWYRTMKPDAQFDD